MIRALAIVAGWLLVSVPVGMAVGWWLGGRNAHRIDPDLSAFCARPACICGDIMCGGEGDY